MDFLKDLIWIWLFDGSDPDSIDLESYPKLFLCFYFTPAMKFMFNDNSEIGSHVRINLCYSICVRHLIRSRAETNRIFSERTFLKMCAKWSELPFNVSTMLHAHCTANMFLDRNLLDTILKCLLIRQFQEV